MIINLNGVEGQDWNVSQNEVTLITDMSVGRYRLPKNSPRIVIQHTRPGRMLLTVGGFTRAAISVEGPEDAVRRLREAVL